MNSWYQQLNLNGSLWWHLTSENIITDIKSPLLLVEFWFLISRINILTLVIIELLISRINIVISENVIADIKKIAFGRPS